MNDYRYACTHLNCSKLPSISTMGFWTRILLVGPEVEAKHRMEALGIRVVRDTLLLKSCRLELTWK